MYVFSPVQARRIRPLMIAGMLLPRRPNAIRPSANCETPVRLPIRMKTPKISAPAACPTTMITIDCTRQAKLRADRSHHPGRRNNVGTEPDPELLPGGRIPVPIRYRLDAVLIDR